MPAATPEMRKADAVNAWRQWAGNAPLDLLQFFQGSRAEMIGEGFGPRRELSVELHAEELEDGGFHVVLAFDPQEEDE